MKKFLFILLLFAGHSFLFAGPQNFFSRQGMEADLFYTRVMAKISYSWEKCKEYFQLMIASVGDDAKYGGRDLGSRAKLKGSEMTDRAMESGKKFVEQEKEKLMKDGESISSEMKEQFQQHGETLRRKSSEFAGKAQQEYQEQKESLRKKTGDFRK